MSFLYDPPILQPSATSSGAALERALREQQTLLDSAGAGIVLIRQRLVVRANPRYAEIFGYASHHDLVGQTSESFYPNRNAFRALGRAAYPVVSQGKTYRTEQLMRRIRPANPSTPNEQLQAPSCPRKPSCTPCLKRSPIRAPVSPARAGSTARNSRLN